MNSKSNNWEITDIPLTNYSVVTEPDVITGEIMQVTKIMENVQKEIIQTKSEQIRNALIDLGWMPPDFAEALKRNLEIAESFIAPHNMVNYEAACEKENERRVSS